MSSPSCIEAFGSKVEGFIGGGFSRLGQYIGHNPRRTIIYAIILTLACGGGFVRWETENRGEKLWVPQDTTAEKETERYESNFASNSRFNNLVVQNADVGQNVLTKDVLVEAMQMHEEIASGTSTVDGTTYDLVELCTRAGGSCVSSFEGVCQCLLTGILKQWNYDLETLQTDDDIMTTINNYGSRQDLEAIVGNPTFDEDDQLVSAEAFTLSYFLDDRSVVKDGSEDDPINEAWEGDVFLHVVEDVAPQKYKALHLDYFAGRSFEDEFGSAISGDLALVQVSYIAAFLFLGANMGQRVLCGKPGSRWTMALAALVAVGLATGAGFGLSSAFGLFFGPVHSLLPFILLGIGVDDAFVIVNAFDRERLVPRTHESNEDLASRAARGLARAGASITVTSATDLVAFGISASSALPALASFCAYAAISIFFLWVFASTFFAACLVFDERRQRDNRRECLCCLTRGKAIEADSEDNTAFEEDLISRYFRNYHAPAILHPVSKFVIILGFAALISFGFYGAINLPVEDSQRNFIPDGYLMEYFDAADTYFPSEGIDLFIVFEGDAEDVYASRHSLADLDEERLTGLSTAPPYISEPVSEEAYRNVMTGLHDYLTNNGSDAVGGVTLGGDFWPLNAEDFSLVLKNFASFSGPGSVYARDVAYDGDELAAVRVKCEYVRLTKTNNGEVIDDADKQIDAMDSTRDLLATWNDLPSSFPYSSKFIEIEGFKIIRREFFQNVILAVAAVGVIVFFTVASPATSVLITVNVAFCIVEILGFMYVLGIVIDSVSVINMVLAVGLSVDYSAHVGHCFMTKGGSDKNQRATEALADIGAAVLSGAVSTFLAVAVLLNSTSYVFEVLSRQFALTVGLGIVHGLILLPVLLSLLGPKPFASAGKEAHSNKTKDPQTLGTTGHASGNEENSNEEDYDQQ